MRIVVNDIAASSGGAMTVLRDFYNAVNSYKDEYEWIFLLGDNCFAETDRVKIEVFSNIKASRLSRLFFDLFLGKKTINELQPDVVFSLQNTIVFGIKAPQVLFVHQPLPFQREKKFSLFKKDEKPLAIIQYFIGSIIKLSIKKANKIIVQTKWMQNAVISQCRVSKEKVKSILPIVPIFDNIYGVGFNRKKFFYPTSNAFYKNIGCIENAIKILEQQNIVCDVELTTDNVYKTKYIHSVGRLSQNEVEKKYFESTLIFPSYIETFGYPLAEAKNAGTIILASNCDFSREVLEGYPNAYFFDYQKPNELANLMKKVIDGEIIKKQYNSNSQQKNTWYQVIDEVVCAKDTISF